MNLIKEHGAEGGATTNQEKNKCGGVIIANKNLHPMTDFGR